MRLVRRGSGARLQWHPSFQQCRTGGGAVSPSPGTPPGGQGGLAHWPAGVPIVPNKSSRQRILLNLIKFKPYLTIGFKQLTVKEVQSAHISAQTVTPITDTGCPNKLSNGTNS